MKIDNIFMQAYEQDKQARSARADKTARKVFIIIPLLVLLAQFLLLRLLG